MTELRIDCPRDWEVESASVLCNHIIKCEVPVRFKDAGELFIKSLSILYVHNNMLGPDNVEGVVGERKMQRVCRNIRDLVFKFHESGNGSCRLTVALQELDAADAAAETVGEITRRAA